MKLRLISAIAASLFTITAYGQARSVALGYGATPHQASMDALDSAVSKCFNGIVRAPQVESVTPVSGGYEVVVRYACDRYDR